MKRPVTQRNPQFTPQGTDYLTQAVSPEIEPIHTAEFEEDKASYPDETTHPTFADASDEPIELMSYGRWNGIFLPIRFVLISVSILFFSFIIFLVSVSFWQFVNTKSLLVACSLIGAFLSLVYAIMAIIKDLKSNVK